MGVRVLSLGPNSPVPGERLQIVIYNEQNEITRRFEQVQGACLDPGYVDFFGSPRCRPAKYLHPIVDIDANGAARELIADFTPQMDQRIYLGLLADWVAAHGIPQEQE